jgi:hypothetical protein
MADRLTPHELETLIRSAAMAPLSPDHVRRVLLEHRQLLADHAELQALLHRLAPAWAQARAVLNELHRLLTDDTDPNPSGHGERRG